MFPVSPSTYKLQDESIQVKISPNDQMIQIVKTLGTSNVEHSFVINPLGEKLLHQCMMESKDHEQSTKFDSIHEKLDSELVDLLRQMLNFNPKDRIILEDAMDHPVFSKIRKSGPIELPDK